MKSNSIKAVLFDLGGVIIQFQKTGYFAQMLKESNDPNAMKKWLACDTLQAYEKGEIDRHKFARGIIEHFELHTHPDKFLATFLDWPQNIFPGSQAIVANIQNHIRVGCLSNTSEFHWDNQKSSTILKNMFKLRFLSFELGLLKPCSAIYRKVAKQLDCTPESILFFDDNKQNIDSAKVVGFEAYLVRGISEAQVIIRERGLFR